MISVQLLSGDYNVGADGTVTYIDGNRIYAFGHRFLDVGATVAALRALRGPRAAAQYQHSFKLSAAARMDGRHRQDRNTAVAGEFGKRAAMVPVSVAVSRDGKPHRNLPDADGQRPAALAAAGADGRLLRHRRHRAHRGRGHLPRHRRDRSSRTRPRPSISIICSAADNGSAMQASLSTAVPVAYVMQSGFDTLRLKSVALNIEAFDQKKQLDYRRHFRRPPRSARRRHRAAQRLAGGREWRGNLAPAGLQDPHRRRTGPLYFTVADANTANLTDFRQVLGANPRTRQRS